MEIEVRSFPEPRTAEVRCALGEFTAQWGGRPTDTPGVYVIEWTIDVELTWGQNATASPAPGPVILTEQDHVLLRGRLQPNNDGTAYLNLGDTSVHLDVTEPLPHPALTGWTDFRLKPTEIELYPYST